jgi:hypothetical protein
MIQQVDPVVRHWFGSALRQEIDSVMWQWVVEQLFRAKVSTVGSSIESVSGSVDGSAVDCAVDSASSLPSPVAGEMTPNNSHDALYPSFRSE